MKIDPEEYVKLGYKMAHMFLRKHPELYSIADDIEQEAALAVIEAAAKWKDKGTIKFSTYCAKEVHNAILKYLRDNNTKHSRVVGKSLEDLLSPESEVDEGSWEDFIPGTVVDVSKAIEELPDDLRNFVSMVNQGYSVHDIRENLGISWKKYDELKQRVADEFREKYS